MIGKGPFNGLLGLDEIAGVFQIARLFYGGSNGSRAFLRLHGGAQLLLAFE